MSSTAGGMDELPAADIYSHVKGLVTSDLEINQIGRGQFINRNRFSGTNEIMRLTGKGEPGGPTIDVAHEPAAVKPPGCRPSVAVRAAQ